MKIPDYELLRRCGHGAYGEVWLARSLTGKLVALKIIFREDAEAREFEGLRQYSKLPDSPYLVRILHTAECEDGFYYTMELADNLASGDDYKPATLANYIRYKRLSPAETVKLGLAMLNALQALHKAGLVHRDVKPENILYINGEPKLSDIGLLRSVSNSVSIVGTIGFIPPEHLLAPLSGGECESDLYALGKVLYCALTGNKVEKFPSFPDDLIGSTACSSLNQVILTACDRNPTCRFHRAEDFRNALLHGLSRKKRVTDGIYKNRFVIGVVICLALVFIVGYLLIRLNRSASAPPVSNRNTAEMTPPPARSVQDSAATPRVSVGDSQFPDKNRHLAQPPVMELTAPRLRYLNRTHTAAAIAEIFGTDVRTVEEALAKHNLKARSLRPDGMRQPRTRSSREEILQLRAKLINL